MNSFEKKIKYAGELMMIKDYIQLDVKPLIEEIGFDLFMKKGDKYTAIRIKPEYMTKESEYILSIIREMLFKLQLKKHNE